VSESPASQHAGADPNPVGAGPRLDEVERGPAMIELRKLTKAFGSKVALRGVDLRVEAGESLVIFGPNGAGKSTLIRILSSLSRPTGGRVLIGGLDLATHADGIRRYLGVVSHAPLLYDSLTAEENLRFFAQLYGMKDPAPRIAEMLERVGLTARRNDLVRTFSRGMVQRLAIARALLHDPQVLLLDEPDTGLDPQAAEMLHGLLVQLSGRNSNAANPQISKSATQQGGEFTDQRISDAATQRTIVTVTHSIERGLAIADRLIILAGGRIVFAGSARGMSQTEFRPLYDKYVGGGR
jgi:heme exporter protein A